MQETENKFYQLSEAQIKEYQENGYLVVPNVFTHEECDRIFSFIRPYANKDFGAIMNPDRPEYLLAQYTACRYSIKETDEAVQIGGVVDKIQEILAKNSKEEEKAKELGISYREFDLILATSSFLRSIMRDPRQADILETLQGRKISALMSQMLFKEAGTRFAREQAWKPHQDNTYPQNPNAQYITTNLFLADADKENGTLFIYPGSHKLGLLPYEPNLSYREKKGTAPGNKTLMPAEWEEKHVDVNFKKGDLLILNGNTIHGSYPNNSSRSRPLYSCSLISQGEFFISGANARRMEIPLR